MYAIFAQIDGSGVNSSVSTFFGTGIGKFIQQLAAIFAILVILYGVYQTGRGFMSGRGVGAVKSLIGSIVVAAFFFNLKWTVDIINFAGKAVNALFQTLNGVA